MNPAHVHLWISHLPIFGTFLGMVVLLHGIWTKNNQTKIAAYNLFVISGIGAAIAYKVGEEAEELVEHMEGILESSIEAHEDFAVFALGSVIVLAVISIGGIIASSLKSLYARKISFVILTAALVSFIITARTGYLGGKIRHTEIDNPPVKQGEEAEHDE